MCLGRMGTVDNPRFFCYSRADMKHLYTRISIVAVSLAVVVGILFAVQKNEEVIVKADGPVTPTVVSTPMDGTGGGLLDEHATVPKTATDDRVLPLMRFSENRKVSGGLISPDGEWLLDVRIVGEGPLSRGALQFLHFINLKGRADRFVYVDWDERPEDRGYMDFSLLHPIGWSDDGKSVYVGWFERYNKTMGMNVPYLENFWGPTGSVVKFDLMLDAAGYSARRSIGKVYDFVPSTGRALMASYTEQYGGLVPIALYVSYPESDKPPVTTQVTIFEKDMQEHEGQKDDLRTITSATLDRSEKTVRAAYVLHLDGQDEEPWYFDTSVSDTASKVDLSGVESRLREHGIVSPYRLVVEKTAMELPSGLFYVVIGADGKTTVIRGSLRDAKWTWSISDDGFL